MRIEELLERATAASQGGRREEARDLLVDVLAAYPNNLEAWLRLAELASSPDRASLYYRRAAEIDPRSLRAQKGIEETQAILGPAGELERPGRVQPCAVLPAEDESPVSPKSGRSAVPAAPPDSPIYVDNESAPFTVDLGPRANAAGRSVALGSLEDVGADRCVGPGASEMNGPAWSRSRFHISGDVEPAPRAGSA